VQTVYKLRLSYCLTPNRTSIVTDYGKLTATFTSILQTVAIYYMSGASDTREHSWRNILKTTMDLHGELVLHPLSNRQPVHYPRQTPWFTLMGVPVIRRAAAFRTDCILSVTHDRCFGAVRSAYSGTIRCVCLKSASRRRRRESKCCYVDSA